MNFFKRLLKNVIGKKNYEKCQFLKKKIIYSTKDKSNYCPCCNSYIKEWYSFKEKQWNDIYNADLFEPQNDKCACPVCKSTPRHRIEANWLNEKNLADKKVLLWAPEESLLIFLHSKKICLITADLKDENVMKKDDIEHSTFSDNEFDYIICNHVLEHVTDVMKALNDSLRILNDGGVALFMVPVNSESDDTLEDNSISTASDRKKVYGQSDHLRLFGNDFEKKLCSAGFKVEKYIGNERCSSQILPIIAPGRYDSNILYICRK